MIIQFTIRNLNINIKRFFNSPFFHGQFDIGQKIVHVVIWQDGGGSIPSTADQVLKLWKHDEAWKSQKKGPILLFKWKKNILHFLKFCFEQEKVFRSKILWSTDVWKLII